jgi:hypothetical protein
MIRRSGALALLIAAAACAPAAAKPVAVNVRVEGIHKTLFEGRITTDINTVDSGDGSGPHKCDGTNGGANATPGPTLLGAFDDATHEGGLSWRGAYSSDFEDFTIDKVGPDASDTAGGKYWGQVLNYKDTQLGGCQIQVHKADKVLIAFNSYGHPKLKLKGPKQVTAGKAFTVTVIDGQSGKPFEGAKVRGRTTDSKGHVKITLKHVRTYRLKATAKQAVRSNALKVHAG